MGNGQWAMGIGGWCFRRAAALIGALVGALVCGSVVQADEVRLRTSAVVEADRPVVVGDVAVLTGDEAIKGAGAVIAASVAELPTDASGRITITMERVRQALRDAGVMGARIAMSGSTCIVRTNQVPQAAPMAGANPETPAHARPVAPYIATDDHGPITVRYRVAEMIARTYGVKLSEVRIGFDPEDEALLGTEEAGRTVIVRPTTTGNSTRSLLEVRIVSGERVGASGVVEAEVEVWRSVVIASADIARRAEMRTGMVREEMRWMVPGGAPVVAHASDADGQRAVRRLRAGDVVLVSDMEGAIAVKRGELVVVECVRNGISLQAKARALSDARVGERVECQVPDSKKTFVGTVDAVGRVVVVLGQG